MSKVNHDLTKVLKPRYANKWIALNPTQTKVLLAEKSIKKLLALIKQKRYKNPIVMYALSDYRGLVS